MFEADKFLAQEFVSAQAVCRMLESYGLQSPGVTTAEKWFERRRVPGRWLPLLLCVKELENGHALSVLKYTKKGNAT